MMNGEGKEDHDLLVTLHEQVKQIRYDIKELKDGTTDKITDHEIRLKVLEVWKVARTEQIKDDRKVFGIVLALGLLILSVLIWHLTGYHI